MLALMLITVAVLPDPCHAVAIGAAVRTDGARRVAAVGAVEPAVVAAAVGRRQGRGAPQQPRTRWASAASREHSDGAGDGMVVSGTPELSRNESLQAAHGQARRELLGRLEARARLLSAESAPGWLPGFVRSRIVERWLRGQANNNLLHVKDQTCLVRDHGFGNSYQTTLLVEEDVRGVQRSLQTLQLRLMEGSRVFAFACGGLALFWSFLALVQGWFDRLTRGYMTWRLRVITGAIAAAPLALLLLV